MEKVYKMPGYDLHLIPTNKFKNITISLKLQNTLDEKTVAKRTLLSFMLTTGTEKYPSTQELSIYLESMYGMKLGANVVTKGKSHIININSICINQEYLPYKEDLIQQQIQLLNDIFFKPNASKTVFDQTMFERKKKEYVERLINNQDYKYYYIIEKMFEYIKRFPNVSLHDCIKYGSLCLDKECEFIPPKLELYSRQKIEKSILLCPDARFLRNNQLLNRITRSFKR